MSQEPTSLLKGSLGKKSYCIYSDLASEQLVFMEPPTREALKLFAYVTSFSPHNKLNTNITFYKNNGLTLVRIQIRVHI